MKASDFMQSNMAMLNTIRKVLEESTEDNFRENLLEGLEVFGPDVVAGLGHLEFG